MDIIPQLLVNSLITGSIYAVAVVGLVLLYSLHKVLNFAHGHVLMLGGYCLYLFHILLEHPLWLAGIECLAAAILASWLLLQWFVFPFLRYNTLLVFVSTLTLGILLESAVSIAFGVNVKSLSQGAFIESLQIGGVYITPLQIFIISSAIICIAIGSFIFHFSSYGRRIRALFESPHASQGLGISLRNTSYIVTIVGSILTMYAGILIGYETNLQPTMGTVYTIKAFAAMILGGLGSVGGAFIACFLIAGIENFCIGIDFFGHSLPAGYKDAFTFGIIVITLLWRPQGLFGNALRKV